MECHNLLLLRIKILGGREESSFVCNVGIKWSLDSFSENSQEITLFAIYPPGI